PVGAELLGLFLRLIGHAFRARGAVVEDGDLLCLEVLDGKDRAGRALGVVPRADAIRVLEPAIGHLRVGAARADQDQIDPVEHLRDRNEIGRASCRDRVYRSWGAEVPSWTEST